MIWILTKSRALRPLGLRRIDIQPTVRPAAHHDLVASDPSRAGRASRTLERAWVEQVASDPEWIEPSRWRSGVELRFGRIAEAGGKVLRVTTIDESGIRVVITAPFDRMATEAMRKSDAADV